MAVRVKLKQNAIDELRRTPEVRATLETHGRRMLAAANRTLDENRGYALASESSRRTGWRVAVYTYTAHAIKSNAKHNTLVRVLGGGR